ncbi:hypothetical protein EMPG_12384 [Blastomyces silverae]|uniref:Fungal N-terminal domain-containing protein n=1 Tax=Blastomyces silverae TaxID=2060906 RepID=A0A0H1BN99_9EURO|nr:hypothetical protein EMPG_12384 [Blastomyces silverae]
MSSEIGTAPLFDSNSPNLTAINAVSILQMVRLGFNLSVSFNTVACRVAASGIDVHTIAKGLSLYVAALKHVGQNLQMKDSPNSPLVLRIAEEISGRGNTIFNSFAKMLDKAQRNDGDLIQERFKRCFRKHHVTYLLALLEALKLSLIVMSQILQLGKLIRSRTPDSIRNDIVQAQRDEVQNMVIVLHWSISRLDRLRYSAICEAEEYSQNAGYASLSNSQLNGTDSPPPSTIPTILPALSFKDLDNSLSPISQDVTGTIHVSSQAIDHLIAQWTQVGGYRGLSGEEARPQRHVAFASDMETNNFRDGLEGRDRQKHHPEGATSSQRRPSQEARKPVTESRKDNSSLQARVETDSEESSDNGAQARRRKVRFSPSGNTSATEEGSHHRGDGGHVNCTDKGKPKTSPSQRRIPTPEFNTHNQQNADGHPRPSRRSPQTSPRAIPEREPQNYGHTSNLSPRNHPYPLASGLYHPQYTNTYLSSSPSHPTQRPSYPPQINTNSQLPRSPSHYTEHPHHHYQHHEYYSPSRRSSHDYATS